MKSLTVAIALSFLPSMVIAQSVSTSGFVPAPDYYGAGNWREPVADEATLPTCPGTSENELRYAISEGTVNYCPVGGSAWVGLSAAVDLTNLDRINFDTTVAADPHTPGNAYWSVGDDVLSFDRSTAGVTMQVGLETHLPSAVNKAGVTIFDMQAVYVCGEQGGTVEVCLAVANAASTSEVVGLVTQVSAANNDPVVVTTFGLVNDVDTSLLAEGKVYLSEATAGLITNTNPTPPNSTAMVGRVLYSHPTQGVVLVSIGYDISDIVTVSGFYVADGLEGGPGSLMTGTWAFQDGMSVEYPAGDADNALFVGDFAKLDDHHVAIKGLAAETSLRVRQADSQTEGVMLDLEDEDGDNLFGFGFSSGVPWLRVTPPTTILGTWDFSGATVSGIPSSSISDAATGTTEVSTDSEGVSGLLGVDIKGNPLLRVEDVTTANYWTFGIDYNWTVDHPVWMEWISPDGLWLPSLGVYTDTGAVGWEGVSINQGQGSTFDFRFRGDTVSAVLDCDAATDSCQYKGVDLDSLASPGGVTGDLQKNDGASGFAASLLNDDGTDVTLGSGQLLVPDAGPPYSFSSDPTAGMYIVSGELRLFGGSGSTYGFVLNEGGGDTLEYGNAILWPASASFGNKSDTDTHLTAASGDVFTLTAGGQLVQHWSDSLTPAAAPLSAMDDGTSQQVHVAGTATQADNVFEVDADGDGTPEIDVTSSAAGIMRFKAGARLQWVPASGNATEFYPSGDNLRWYTSTPGTYAQIRLRDAGDYLAVYDEDSATTVLKVDDGGVEISGDVVVGTGNLHLGGATHVQVDTYSTDQALTVSNGYVVVDTTSTVTLPACVVTDGRGPQYTVKVESGSGAVVTIDANGIETIDDDPTIVLTDPDAADLTCYETGKWSIS